jgi:hypothetical protein
MFKKLQVEAVAGSVLDTVYSEISFATIGLYLQ